MRAFLSPSHYADIKVADGKSHLSAARIKAQEVCLRDRLAVPGLGVYVGVQ